MGVIQSLFGVTHTLSFTGCRGKTLAYTVNCGGYLMNDSVFYSYRHVQDGIENKGRVTQSL